MRTKMNGVKEIALVGVCALAVGAWAGFGTMASKPIWDLAKDAGEVSAALAKKGFVPLGSAHAFTVPHTAVKDSTAFTVEARIRCTAPQDNTSISLFSQQTSGTGWSLGLLLYPRVGSPITLGMNNAWFNTGWFRSRTNEVHTFTIAARKGLVTVYWNGHVLKRFFGLITPNLEPIRIGGKPGGREMPGVELLSLRFWGPEEEYYAKGESTDFAEGFRGGPGWSVSCPTEKPGSTLPRILCYGDSILSGYGSRLRGQTAGQAYVYTWSNFVSDHQAKHLNKKAFVSAASVAKFDAIVFNNGLHSLHWTENKATDAEIKDVVRGMLNAFRAGAPQAKIYWLATTPQTAREKNAAGKVEKTGELDPIVRRINRLAAEVMAEEKVPVIDAYALLAPHLDLASGDGYHWKGEAYDLMAKTIRETVLSR